MKNSDFRRGRDFGPVYAVQEPRSKAFLTINIVEEQEFDETASSRLIKDIGKGLRQIKRWNAAPIVKALKVSKSK